MKRRLIPAGILAVALLFTISLVQAESAPPAASGAPGPTIASAGGTNTGNPTLAVVQQLESEAFKAIRGGDFDKSDSLLNQAASLSPEPRLQHMAELMRQFEKQRQSFTSDRRAQYDKAVSEMHLLLDHKMDAYATDEAEQAYLLADDKEAFLNEPWVKKLIQESADSAEKYDDSKQWLKASRLYSDLCALQPANSDWRDRFDASMRRVSLLMIYAPSELKRLQDIEGKDRKAADELLGSATRPSEPGPVASAATQPSDPDEIADNSQMDWRDIVKGVQYDMLWDSLIDAQQQYFRDITFQDLLKGGLNGLTIMVTTDGLEKTFPNIGDAQKRDEFLAGIKACMADANAATDDNGEVVLTKSLNTLRDLNNRTLQLPEEVFVCEFATGAFSVLDPFSKVVWPSEAREIERMTQGEFGGVGLEIQNDEQGNIRVVTPLEDTPAYHSGIQAGDIITRINGKSAKGMIADRAVELIVGTPGTEVTLTIRSSDGVEKDHLLKRDTIKVASVEGFARKPGGGWSYLIDPQQKIAFVRLTSFSKTTSDDLDKAIAEMQADGARGIVLDLRDNLGGLLPAATAVVNKFVGDGVIVSTHADRITGNPPVVINAESKDLQLDVPMVVLVNQFSASASEIVSGALKDHARAIIIGERTYGKGSVQMLYPLDEGKAFFKLTTAHYYLPSGRCIHREKNSTTWGVDPDVRVEMTPKQMLAVIAARHELDALRDPTLEGGAASAATRPTQSDLLQVDAQLSAGVLLLRLELVGATL